MLKLVNYQFLTLKYNLKLTNYRMNHGETLRKIRVQKGFSQEYVASKLGKRQTSYSQWERKSILDNDRILQVLKILETTKETFDSFGITNAKEESEIKVDSHIVKFLIESNLSQQEIIKELTNALSSQTKNKRQ
jgi:transcriptional regulator with XRE-family HTH domain